MSLPLWGLLEKAQDNDQTIDEAIAAAIVGHEEDPTAHLGDGESLQAHKNNEVIDHPSQSVVLDKIPFEQYDEFRADLGSHDWSFEDGSGTLDPGLISFSLFSQTDVDLIGETQHEGHADYPDADLMYQFKITLNGQQSADGDLNFAWTDDVATDTTRMSIEKDGTTYWWRLYRSGTVESEYEFDLGNNWTKYIRIWYDSVNDTIRLYVGSTEVVAYVDTDWRDFVFPLFDCLASRTTNTSISLNMTDWKMVSNINVDI